MVGSIIPVEWKTTWLKAGWAFPKEYIQKEISEEDLLLSKFKLWRVPRRLLDPALSGRFRNLIEGTPFSSLWSELTGGRNSDSADRTFLLKFSKGDWDVPWELLIGELYSSYNRRTVSLIRSSSDTTPPVAPRVFITPLKTLVLKGAPGGKNLDILDLNKEVETILEAWENLELNVRQSIAKPDVADATRKDITAHLASFQPDIIWYTGHGEAEPARLWFADETWVSAQEFADFILKSQHKPLYVLLSACDTARRERGAGAGSYSPLFFEKLANVGVHSVLAMQSPFGAASALVLTRGLFRYLSTGLPLEKALARVRAELHDTPPPDSQAIDWASPVVWSAGTPVDKLEWNAQEQKLAQFQVLGRYALEWGQGLFPRQENSSQLNSPISEEDKSRSAEWAGRPRTWIRGDAREAEHRLHWLQTLRAIQTQTPWFVIAIEFSTDNPLEALPLWAQSVYKQMLPMDFPEDIARVIEKISRVPVEGWRELCDYEGIYVAIANAPRYADEAGDEHFWFWQPLLSDSERLRVAVMSEQEVPANLNEKWEIELLTDGVEEHLIASAVAQAPRLARALAVLNMPLRSSRLFVSAKEGKGIASIRNWPGRGHVTIETAGGPTLTAKARKYVLAQITSAQELRDAHQDCANILGNPEIQRTVAIREHLTEHLMKAGREDDAVIEADNLFRIYHEENNPSSVLELANLLGPHKKNLSSHSLLILAWAYGQLGRSSRSFYWLGEAQVKDHADIAWRHGLLAEAYKSNVEEDFKNKARDEILAAIQVCEEAVRTEPNKWFFIRRKQVFRQDLARIKQFLFYELDEAAHDYRELIEELSNNPGLDLAIVKRNYAECLLSLSGDHNELWEEAIENLLDAEALAGHFPYAPLLAEVLYEKAKVAEQSGETEGPFSDPDKYLSECISAARKSQHYMLKAIAESRLFWRSGGLPLARWREIASELKSFSSHGWAFRTLINGRLRTAKLLEKSKELDASFAELESSREALNERPSFNQGRSDRFRIAATMAGLQVVGQKLGHSMTAWDDFLAQHSWATKWLEQRPLKTATEIWSEVE